VSTVGLYQWMMKNTSEYIGFESRPSLNIFQAIISQLVKLCGLLR